MYVSGVELVHDSANLRGAEQVGHMQTDLTFTLSAHTSDHDTALSCTTIVLQRILHHTHDLGDEVGTTSKAGICGSGDSPMYVSTGAT